MMAYGFKYSSIYTVNLCRSRPDQPPKKYSELSQRKATPSEPILREKQTRTCTLSRYRGAMCHMFRVHVVLRISAYLEVCFSHHINRSLLYAQRAAIKRAKPRTLICRNRIIHRLTVRVPMVLRVL